MENCDGRNHGQKKHKKTQKNEKKIPYQNRSQVQVSLKVIAQIDHLNITVTLDF